MQIGGATPGIIAPGNVTGLPSIALDQGDVNKATIEALKSIADRVTAPTGLARSTTRNYEEMELDYLFERIGAPKVNGTFTGLGVESLPDFFRPWSVLEGTRRI
jgi:hypothetical protein